MPPTQKQTRNTTLALAAKAGDERALETLVSENTGLIMVAAKPYLRLKGMEEDDLWQHGYLALTRAAKTFDPEIAEYSTWALMWIRHELQQAAGFADGLTRANHQDRVAVMGTRDALLNELGREPTPEEVRDRVKQKTSYYENISLERVVALLNHGPSISLDADLPGAEGDEGSWYDILVNPNADSPEGMFVDTRAREEFWEFVWKKLSPLQARVIELEHRDGYFVYEIATILGKSPEAVSVIKSEAIEILGKEENACILSQLLS